MKKYIKGNYRKAIYKSNNYIIGLFKVRETNDETLNDYINKTITFTGYFYELNEDDNYFLYGDLIIHPKYGVQYQVTEYERVKPEDKSGIIEFLSSELFPGIGIKIASKIVDELGVDAISKILKDKGILKLIPKLSDKKIDTIYNTLYNYENSHQTIVFITELGIPLKDALTIYSVYKEETMDRINNNIYDVIDGATIDFIKIDRIRQKLEIEELDKRRIKAGIVYVIRNICYQNGDTCTENNNILMALNNNLNISITLEELDNYLDELIEENMLKCSNKRYYLNNLWDSEDYIAKKIVSLSTKETENNKNIDNYIDFLENNNNIKYNDKQREAIKKALSNNLLIITGGPGTGKTTIIKVIVEIYSQINKLSYDEVVDRIALLAPTGRASKRMSESTLLPAMTIHRFLKWNKETDEFAVNQYNPDFSHLIIVDEASMLDTELFSNLLKGLTNNIKLILVGDYNQLPSVGPGQVLKDLIDSNIIDTIKLEYLYRQDENSYIATLANEINLNELSLNFLESKSDYQFFKATDIIGSLKKICEQIISKKKDYKKFQLMAPMYMGEHGIDKLNVELQRLFNPKEVKKNEIKYGDVIYRENDKVIQLTNMPDENIYNGDIGVIKKIVHNENKTEVFIDYDSISVKYNLKDLVKIKHAYIISIHKSQGSEFEIVVLPISLNYRRMLYRKLIYTAVTRAKEKLIIVGNPDAFIYAVENNNEYIRKTSLLDKIISYLYNN